MDKKTCCTFALLFVLKNGKQFLKLEITDSLSGREKWEEGQKFFEGIEATNKGKQISLKSIQRVIDLRAFKIFIQ
ncbi:MAG TPA: hypothetical protein P5228_11725 [Bacteroidales bacterium]|nr:hypothetical protein [Bacteroidales bacterium]